MNWEQLKQIILKHPHLIKITPSVLSKAFNNLTGEDLDYTKTYGEQGLDDLDIIEMVMYLEKDLNIHIHDDIVDTLFSSESYPINMTFLYREERLVELGI
jgi:acyl carrier protein